MEDFGDLSEADRAAITDAMVATFFAGNDPSRASPEGKVALDEHVYTRYRTAIRNVVPWIAKRVPLADARVLEIGCGTGSSTAAMARAGARVVAYDIDAPAIEGARRRLSTLGLTADLHLVEPEALLRSIRGEADVDVVLLYAVLEHMTISERLATIEAAWGRLRPGGVLVVFDTPNRLFFVDYHTSLMPFFHTLPDDLALRTAARSPRRDFRESMRAGTSESLARWGRGVSFHEFAAVLGDLGPLIAADGFDPAILSLLPLTPLENLLREVFILSGVDAPIGFSRASVDVILRKPDPSSPAEFRPDAPPAADLNVVAMLQAQARARELETQVQLVQAQAQLVQTQLQERETRIRDLETLLQPFEDTKARVRELESTLQTIESSIWYRSVAVARKVPGYETARTAAARLQDAVRALKGR